MNAEFYNRIAQPEHPALRDLAKQARSDVEAALTEWGLEEISPSVVRNLSFTYYHDWEHDDPECLLVIQDSGPLYDRHRNELQAIRNLRTDPDPLELVSLHR